MLRKWASFEVPQQNKGPLKGFFFLPPAFALPTGDLLQCLCNFLGQRPTKERTRLLWSKLQISFCSWDQETFLVWFGSTLFSTWTSVHPGKGKCKKQRQKKAKFFIIKTGKLLFLTGNSTCQKMLTLCGDKRSFFLDFTWVHFRNADNFLERKKVRF